MKRRFTYLWIAIGVLVLFVFIYLPGISRYHELKSEEERLTRELREIDSQIQKLQEEKTLLQNDLVYLEKVIREELGLVKPGEMVYKVVPGTKAPTQNSSTENRTS